ncbi:MAG: carboxymuconolactone decarboxylase family protein [Proteobacteria bacterium]|nr:carboxymuconolactone decarboxylase family protein [Pseudomonadota bacterium]
MTIFKIHTPDSAPEKSREILKAISGKLGFVPNVVGELAESPATLKGWVDLKAASETGLLSPVERRIVHMTASYLNNCSYCIAAGTTLGEKESVPRDLLDDLRADRPLKDPKFEQLRQFTKSMMKKWGRPDSQNIDAFLKAGYTNAHILEVIMGISLSVMGNYTNHIAATPLDKAFEPNKVEARQSGGGRSSAAA